MSKTNFTGHAAASAADVQPAWSTAKPDYACVFVGRRGNEYSLWNFVWIAGEAPEDFKGYAETIHYYLGWTDTDGNEWDDYDECKFDGYLVIAKLPTMDQVHALKIKTRTTRQVNRIK